MWSFGVFLLRHLSGNTKDKKIIAEVIMYTFFVPLTSPTSFSNYRLTHFMELLVKKSLMKKIMHLKLLLLFLEYAQ